MITFFVAVALVVAVVAVIAVVIVVVVAMRWGMGFLMISSDMGPVLAVVLTIGGYLLTMC